MLVLAIDIWLVTDELQYKYPWLDVGEVFFDDIGNDIVLTKLSQYCQLVHLFGQQIS